MKSSIKTKIEKCKNGDIQAKEWLYKEYAPVLLGVCLRYIRNREQAEDILHESFITIYSKIWQLKKNEAIEGWMKRIVVNQALIFIRNNNTNYEISNYEENIISEEKKTSGIKERILNANVSQDDILNIINELPIGYRTVFNLYAFEKLKHKEIAKQLCISVGTSRSQLQRARCIIQKKIYELIEKDEKSRKKELTYFLTIPLILNKKLDYIDKFVVEKLDNYSVIPIHSAPSSVAECGKTLVNVGSNSKWILFLGKNILWILSSVIAVTGISTFLYINNTKTTKKHDSNNATEQVILSSGAELTPNSDAMTDSPTNNIAQPDSAKQNEQIPGNRALNQADETVIQSKKVIVRKKVIVTKKVVKEKE